MAVRIARAECEFTLLLGWVDTWGRWRAIHCELLQIPDAYGRVSCMRIQPDISFRSETQPLLFFAKALEFSDEYRYSFI